MEDHTITGEEMLIDKREEEYNKEKKDEFLEKLNALNPRDLLFRKENYPLALDLLNMGRGGMNKVTESFFCRNGELPLKGIDLSSTVKHFSHSELAPLTHLVGDDYVLGKTVFGRLLQAQGIFVKTWDLIFPTSYRIALHSKRLRNEIMILTSMNHHCLPKLRGYSIDKWYALVYQQEPSWTLHHFLSCPDFAFTWDKRIEVASQIADLMEYFHSRGKTLGSIDPENILVDMDMNVKLCEFGLCGPIDEKRTRQINSGILPNAWCFPGGVYSYQVRECVIFDDQNPRKPVGWTWTAKCDIYCFGCLLLELISTELEHSVDSRKYDDFKHWATQKLANKREKNLVDKCLNEDSDVGIKATRIVMACLNDCPAMRPEAKRLLRAVEGLKGEENGAARKRTGLEHEESLGLEKRPRTEE